jgi:sugar/nucleoside kinase (ribokinase family)
VIQAATVLVVGSVNCDVTVRTARFPAPGDTVAGGPVLFGLGRDGSARHVAVPAPVRMVDVTGAGDAFVGVLAAELAAGSGLDTAVASGVAAVSRTVQVTGAAQSYPDFAREGTLRR